MVSALLEDQIWMLPLNFQQEGEYELHAAP
jgi:hypothetical protein